MAESESLGHKALKGTIWASIDRFSTIGVQFIVNIVLARLLLPSDFGAIGMLTIFIGVTQVIIDGGFISALIQKKEPTQTDYSTIFYWNVALALILYGVLFAAAPFIAEFYRMPILCNILRVLGLWIIVFSVNVVQTARLRKEMSFKSIAITNLSAVIVSGGIGIILAVNGFGVWSLVAQQISYGVVTTIAYYIMTRWHPSLTFSRQCLHQLFSFGGYMFVATVLQEICRNFQGIIIGRRFSATQMGYYTQAQRLDMVTSNALPQVIAQVMFPVYSSLQDDNDHLIQMIKTNIRIIAFIVFPLMGILIIAAEPIMTILYGEKWLPCAIFFQILCCGGVFACLQNVNYYAVAAVGKSRQLFIWSFYKWGFMLAAMFVGMNFGILGLMWGLAFSSLNIYLVNALLVSRFIRFRLSAQIRLLAPIFLTSLVGVASGAALNHFLGVDKIACGLFCGVVFILLNVVFHTEALASIITVLKKLKHNHK